MCYSPSARPPRDSVRQPRAHARGDCALGFLGLSSQLLAGSSSGSSLRKPLFQRSGGVEIRPGLTWLLLFFLLFTWSNLDSSVDFGFDPNQPKIIFSSLYLVTCGFLCARSNVASRSNPWFDQHLSPTLGWLVSGVRRAESVPGHGHDSDY
jgi:hypothetical protein